MFIYGESISKNGTIMRRLLLLGGLAVVVVATATTVAFAGSDKDPYTVSGKVMCFNHAGTVGIWVDAANGGSGFATLHDVDVADGWGWTRYSATIPHGGSFRLNVGCGGNPQSWEMTAHSDSYKATQLDLICNDVPPWLEWLGKRFVPIIGRAFKIDVPYGHCSAAHQVAHLEPKPTGSPAVVKPLPMPTPSLARTLGPVTVRSQQPRNPTTRPATSIPPAAPPPPVHQPVIHYQCANDNSNIGHYIPSGKSWYEGFTARAGTITGGWVLIGAAENGANHAGWVQIFTGPLRTGTLIAQVQVNARGYDGESFTFPQPVPVADGQVLYLTVTGIGDFTAYDSAAGCFIARVEGQS